MNRITRILNVYLKRYISTRMVFAMDVVLSLLASLLSVLFADVLVGSGAIGIGRAIVWTLVGGATSALFVYLLRTYRIIIRHTTLRQLALFGAVALGQATLVLIIYSLIYVYSTTALLAAVADFLLTFTVFVITRALMAIAYDIVKERMETFGFEEFSDSCRSFLTPAIWNASLDCLTPSPIRIQRFFTR